MRKIIKYLLIGLAGVVIFIFQFVVIITSFIWLPLGTLYLYCKDILNED